MRLLSGLIVALITVTEAAATPENPEDVAACTARLDRSLRVMESLPLLKEEKATALMWLRLDAINALADDDVELCLENLATVDRILGLPQDDQTE